MVYVIAMEKSKRSLRGLVRTTALGLELVAVGGLFGCGSGNSNTYTPTQQPTPTKQLEVIVPSGNGLEVIKNSSPSTVTVPGVTSIYWALDGFIGATGAPVANDTNFILLLNQNQQVTYTLGLLNTPNLSVITPNGILCAASTKPLQGLPDIFMINAAGTSPKFIGTPQPIGGTTYLTASPNGASCLFTNGNLNNPAKITEVDTSTANETQIPINATFATYSPDSKTIWAGTTTANSPSLTVVDDATKNVTKTYQLPGAGITGPVIFNGAQEVYTSTAAAANEGANILVVNTSTQQLATISSTLGNDTAVPPFLALSPDTKWLTAIVKTTDAQGNFKYTLVIVDTSSNLVKTTMDLATFPVNTNVAGFGYAASSSDGVCMGWTGGTAGGSGTLYLLDMSNLSLRTVPLTSTPTGAFTITYTTSP